MTLGPQLSAALLRDLARVIAAHDHLLANHLMAEADERERAIQTPSSAPEGERPLDAVARRKMVETGKSMGIPECPTPSASDTGTAAPFDAEKWLREEKHWEPTKQTPDIFVRSTVIALVKDAHAEGQKGRVSEDMPAGFDELMSRYDDGAYPTDEAFWTALRAKLIGRTVRPMTVGEAARIVARAGKYYASTTPPALPPPTSWKCKADRIGVGGNDPQDCDWPTCGCDPHADKVIAALEEAGVLPGQHAPRAMEQATEWLARCLFKALCESIGLSEETAIYASGADWHQFLPDAHAAVAAAMTKACGTSVATDHVPWDAATFVRSLPVAQTLHEQLERTPFEYAVEVADAVRARFVAERDRRQVTVQEWAIAAFGPHCATNIGERVARVLEEAIELVQAEGLLPVTARQILDYVYAREPGDPAKEAGGLGITLLAYCQARGISADEAERQELARVLSKPLDHFAARHNAKADAGVAMPTDKPTEGR